jgi:hypothetical protein
MAEVEANNRRVQELASEEGLKTTQNVAAGVAGIFIPVLWFGMGFPGCSKQRGRGTTKPTAISRISGSTAVQPASGTATAIGRQRLWRPGL